MDNISFTVQEGILTISIDLTKDFGLSKTGKSNTVATTHGFVPVGEDISISINCNRKLKYGL